MQTVEQLESMLAEAKLLAKQQEDEKKLNQLQQWVGKCFSSHVFQRVPRPGKSLYIRKIEDVKIDPDGRAQYYFYQLEFMNWYDGKFKVEVLRSCSNEPYPTWFASWSHEITPELFDEIADRVRAHAETYFDVISSLFKHTDSIANRDSCNETAKTTLLESAGHTFLPLPDNVLQTLSWNNHPFIYEGRLLNTPESISIIKTIADNLIKNARDWGGTILSRDQPRYEALIYFYNKYKDV